MRKIDEKFSTTDTGEIIKPSNGEILPHDEPLLLFRARDRLVKPSTVLFLVCGVLLICSAICHADVTGTVVGVLFLAGTLLTWRAR